MIQRMTSYFGKPHRLRWRIARLTGHPWDWFHTLWNPDDKSFPKSSEPFLWVVYEPRNSQSKLVRFSKIWWTSSVISTSSVSADISTSSSDLNCSAILNILFTFTFISYNTQQSFNPKFLLKSSNLLSVLSPFLWLVACFPFLSALILPQPLFGSGCGKLWLG